VSFVVFLNQTEYFWGPILAAMELWIDETDFCAQAINRASLGAPAARSPRQNGEPITMSLLLL
jgi:hypothetical protein